MLDRGASLDVRRGVWLHDLDLWLLISETEVLSLRRVPFGSHRMIDHLDIAVVRILLHLA